MNFRSSLVSTLLAASLLAAGSAYAQNSDASQKVNLSEKLKIPGATLKPGDYTFSLEDRLQDRAIVRITSQDQSKHFLVLSVPSSKLAQPGSDGLIRFTTANGKDQVLRGWACSSCTPGLEFVYPKAEAAKLTDETAEPVLAVDPTYDKLPANLSPDDMKVVTLWLLSPERITASNKGKGVKAEKYASVSQPNANTQTAAANASANTSEVAQAPAPAVPAAPVTEVAPPAATPAPAAPAPAASSSSSEAPAPMAPVQAATAPGPAAQPTEVASASVPATPAAPAERLPKTASSDYLYLFGGMLLVAAALGVRLTRHVAVARS